MVPQECSQHQDHLVAGERDQSVHRRQFNRTASDESSSGCREDPGTKHGLDQGCSRGMSATAHRRTNCGCHRAAQDYTKNTHVQSNVFCGDNAETTAASQRNFRVLRE